VIWPALLLAAGLKPPRGMVIHGYLLMGEKKMSKSLGNVLDPFEAIDRFGADALRFYCFREVSFGQDGSVSAAGFEARYETELANDFGNLASRTLAMLERYRDCVVPGAGVDPAVAGGEGGLEGLAGEVSDLIDQAEPSQALEAIWARVRRLNRYVEETRPWDLAKDEAQADRLDQVLMNLAEGLRVVTLALLPYIPDSAEKLLDALGEAERGLAEFGSRGGGARVERIDPLFPKMEA
jgi:methionyl-tRNA synthetase